MLASELESLAARHVPGKGTLDISRLGAGLVNETYKVLRDGRAYALRIAAANPFDLGFDHAWEARVLECAVRSGLAPPLEYCDPERGILVARWIDGRFWTAADVRQRSNVRKIANLARRIHALPMPACARALSPAQWIESYDAALTRRRVISSRHATDTGDLEHLWGDVSLETPDQSPESIGAPDRHDLPGSRDSPALRMAAARCLATLAELPSADPVVCHSDLHVLNLIDSDHSLLLLDWEYAHASDPLWDLAGWSANNDLEGELRHELLASYTGRTPLRTECSRLQLLIWLYDYVCLLWSELYLYLHRDAANLSVSARAQLLASRLAASSR